MPLSNDGGRDIRLLRNAATGAFDSFDWDGSNNPIFDDSDEHIVLSCVYEVGYWANPLRASTIPAIGLDKTGTDVQLQAAAEDALQPALDARQIKSITVTVAKRGPGNYSLSIGYQNRDGHRKNTRVPIGS